MKVDGERASERERERERGRERERESENLSQKRRDTKMTIMKHDES